MRGTIISTPTFPPLAMLYLGLVFEIVQTPSMPTVPAITLEVMAVPTMLNAVIDLTFDYWFIWIFHYLFREKPINRNPTVSPFL
jgi:hypothetical protein